LATLGLSRACRLGHGGTARVEGKIHFQQHAPEIW
jgi:hypothetical protein